MSVTGIETAVATFIYAHIERRGGSENGRRCALDGPAKIARDR